MEQIYKSLIKEKRDFLNIFLKKKNKLEKKLKTYDKKIDKYYNSDNIDSFIDIENTVYDKNEAFLTYIEIIIEILKTYRELKRILSHFKKESVEYIKIINNMNKISKLLENNLKKYLTFLKKEISDCKIQPFRFQKSALSLYQQLIEDKVEVLNQIKENRSSPEFNYHPIQQINEICLLFRAAYITLSILATEYEKNQALLGASRYYEHAADVNIDIFLLKQEYKVPDTSIFEYQKEIFSAYQLYQKAENLLINFGDPNATRNLFNNDSIPHLDDFELFFDVEKKEKLPILISSCQFKKKKVIESYSNIIEFFESKKKELEGNQENKMDILTELIDIREKLNNLWKSKYNFDLLKQNEKSVFILSRKVKNEEEFNNFIGSLSLLIDQMNIKSMKEQVGVITNGRSIDYLEEFLKNSTNKDFNEIINNFRKINRLRSKKPPFHPIDQRFIKTVKEIIGNYPPDWTQLQAASLQIYIKSLKKLIHIMKD